jgi:pyridoxine 5-phosphate synthase
MGSIFLGVNVDHVATVRQARGTDYPDPVELALLAESNGADGITMHLREDRRHVVERDIEKMQQLTQTKLNMEMAATDEMCKIALRVLPADVCIVPERREELTTEGGLDVASNLAQLAEYCDEFTRVGIATSLFIDPDKAQVDAAKRVNAPVVELHTGSYANAVTVEEQQIEYLRIASAANYAQQLGLIVNGGHGLHYSNTQKIAAISVIHELNIGHAIVAQALITGFPAAVKSMKALMVASRNQSIANQPSL